MAFTASSWGQGQLLTGLSPGSSLSGYTAVITKANLPASALNAGSLSCLNGGGDWRFSTDINGSTQLPVDIIACVTNSTASSTEFVAEIRFPTYASGARSVYAFWNKAGESQPAASAAFGSEDVWQDFLAALHLYGGSLADSSGNGYNGTLAGSSPTALSVQGYSFSNGFINLGSVPLDGRSTVSVYCTFKNSAASADRGIWYLNNDGDSADIPFGLRQDSAAGGTSAVDTFTSSFSKLSFYIRHKNNSSTTSVQRSCNVFDAASASVYMDGADDFLAGGGSQDPSVTLNVGTGDLRIGTGPKSRYSGEIYSYYVKKTADSADFCASKYSNQSNPSSFWTAGAVFVPGGVSKTVSIVEAGPSFADSISASVTSAGVITTSILESGPSFTDSIASTVTGNISASIASNGPVFTDSITVLSTGNITTSIVGIGPSFTDAISITSSAPSIITTSIIESGPSFSDAILVAVPTAWTDKVKVVTNWTDR
jgi:hypothetical protein